MGFFFLCLSSFSSRLADFALVLCSHVTVAEIVALIDSLRGTNASLLPAAGDATSKIALLSFPAIHPNAMRNCKPGRIVVVMGECSRVMDSSPLALSAERAEAICRLVALSIRRRRMSDLAQSHADWRDALNDGKRPRGLGLWHTGNQGDSVNGWN